MLLLWHHLRYKSTLGSVQQLCKRFCCSEICIFEMIALIPFKSTVYMTIVQVVMNWSDRVSHLCHHRIARFLLFVAETQIYCFRLYPILKDVVLEIRKPYWRWYRCNSFKCISLIRCPRRKESGYCIASYRILPLWWSRWSFFQTAHANRKAS